MDTLIRHKPFWALFITQFLGAFNDNFFRTALITLITYHLTTYSDMTKSLFVSAAFGLFMLPFFIFSPLAGQFADRYDKAKVIRWVKGAEIFIVILSTYGFIHQDPFFLLAILFCMGTHSAFFGPAKYSILPDILPQNKLLKGNGYIEAGTFLAIMFGTLWGAMVIHFGVPLATLGAQLGIVSLFGFVASWQIPALPSRAPRLKIDLFWWRELKKLSHYTRKNLYVFKAIMSISWFWLVGALLMAQLPAFAKDVIRVEESVFIFLLLLFTVGLGAGSLFCHWLFKGEITIKFVPLLAFLMALFLFDISGFKNSFSPHRTVLFSFLGSFQGLRLTLDIFGLSSIGGLYIVPLYTFIQAHVVSSQRSQVMAFNNIMNAGFMVLASFVSFCLLSLGVSIPTLIFLAGLGQLGLAVYMLGILPEFFLKSCLYKVLRFLFRLEVKGLEHFAEAGERVILIANHTSYLDALLITVVLPEKPLFAINRAIAERWWVKPFLVLAKVFPIDPLYPYTLRDVIEEAKKGEKVLIFPEGRVTLTGGLMKIYEGPGMVAEKSQARLLPIRIEGAQYTFFSLMKGQVPHKLFPKITLTILPSSPLTIDPSLVGRARRRALSEQLYDLMTEMIFKTSPLEKTLFSSLIDSRRLYGAFTCVLEDMTRKTLTYAGLLLKTFMIARLFTKKAQLGESVGIMLPNSHGLLISFWALQVVGRVSALLNYTSGPSNLLAACQASQVNHVYTSRLLVEKARLQEALTLLRQHKIHIHYLEDEIKKITLRDKLWGVYGMFFPEKAYQTMVPFPHPHDRCVILFTSGTEGVPKGVALSHFNLQANRYQLASVVDFNGNDRVFNILPLFHAFGLTGGMLIPLLSGIKTFHYFSPLHYRTVAELVYDFRATILYGTNTFLFGYGRVAHPYDFHTIRYVFAGAEKLKDDTQKLWFDKFGVRIFEGYGVTETSPVLCVNTAMHYKAGTVGRFLPGISYRFEPMEGLLEGGRLWVHGPNIMKGYLLVSSPGYLISPPEGWYDTGDIVEKDQDGYVRILGRAKRFAKVGGELISLVAVEEAVERFWPGYTHAVLAQPDSRKGEQLLLFTNYSSAKKDTLAAFWREKGLSELSFPRAIHILPSLPLLGSGKVDYKALEKRIQSEKI